MRVKEEDEKASLKLNIKKTKIMAFGPITSWQIEGEKEAVTDLKITWMVTAAIELKDALWKESSDKTRQHIKKQRHHFAHKGPHSQSYVFLSSHV